MKLLLENLPPSLAPQRETLARCLVAEGAERQLKAAQKFSEAIWDIWPCPPFTLLPIAPARLEEKKARGDFFYATVLGEGCSLPRKTDASNPADWLWIAASELEAVSKLAALELMPIRFQDETDRGAVTDGSRGL